MSLFAMYLTVDEDSVACSKGLILSLF